MSQKLTSKRPFVDQSKKHEKQLSDSDKQESKKVFIKTYGCQMNVYDTTRMADSLGGEGYSQTDQIEDADLVLLNTCCLLYTSPSPRDQRGSRMPSSA